jgi:hypothetical protein
MAGKGKGKGKGKAVCASAVGDDDDSGGDDDSNSGGDRDRTADSATGDGTKTVRAVCGRSYCAKCGNTAHPDDDVCPPTAETLQWLGKNTKKCPNCFAHMEKNGGEQHVVCSMAVSSL